VFLGTDLLRDHDALEASRPFARPAVAEERQRKLQESASRFFRGTAALFYRLAATHPEALQLARGQSPRWVVGDVHLENIGALTLDGERYTYDLNDLDEAAHAAGAWDVLRGAVACVIAVQDLGAGFDAAVGALHAFARAYKDQVPFKAPRSARDLVALSRKERLETILRARTQGRGDKRRFRRWSRYLGLAAGEGAMLRALLERWALGAREPGLTLLDARFRVQGTGSLGVHRYALLVGDREDRAFLLDAKEMHPSALVTAGLARPPRGRDLAPLPDALRVLTAEAALRGHAVPGVQALSGTDGRSYLVRRYAPGEFKLDLERVLRERPEELQGLAATLGHRLREAHRRAGHEPSRLDEARVRSIALDLGSHMVRAWQELRSRSLETM
jgi:uncharacterized protein (DUF2252 family)